MKRIASKKIEIDQLETWDVAETLLPEYSPEQYHDLEEFLAKGGQLAPIVVSEDNIIIDGYNRWRLATRLQLIDIECDVYEYGDEAEMEMHAIVLNSKRRHLNKLQVARAAVRLATLDKTDDAEENQENVVSQDIEAVVVQENDSLQEQSDIFLDEKNEITSDIIESEKVVVEEKIVEKNDVSDTNIKHVAKKLGIPQSTVKQVRRVDNSQDKTLINAMEDKIITIKQAAEIAEMAEDKRQEAIEKYDLERMKRNSVSAVLSRSCDNFRKRLKNQQKKLVDAELSYDECEQISEQMHQVISETQDILELLKEQYKG